MTLGHFLYIPGILLVGIAIGWVLAGRLAATARGMKQEQDVRAAARDARRRAREE